MGGVKRASFALSLLVVMGAAAALARDETRGERVSGDDDPIVAAPSVALAVGDVVPFDPEATGSIGKRQAKKKHQPCDRYKFYPDRPLELQFEQAC
ncbi:MAG TPA: hypothetical protein VHN20_02240 [Beijerinckiaceae bacterium]|nr:hypothetical protein [Beijerinckiaceae bacterium]